MRPLLRVALAVSMLTACTDTSTIGGSSDSLPVADGIGDVNGVSGSDASLDSVGGPWGGKDVVLVDTGNVDSGGTVVGDGGGLLDVGGDVAMQCGAEGDFGCPCEAPKDCLSGYCIGSRDGLVCTEQCVSTCPAGWGCKQDLGSSPDVVFICVPLDLPLCAPCKSNKDCSDETFGLTGSCIPGSAGSAFCGTKCGAEEPCPKGYDCADATDVTGAAAKRCVPQSGECTCSWYAELKGNTTLCDLTNELGTCSGERWCEDGTLVPCDATEPAEETCNGADDDCDGDVDEGLLGLHCEVENEFGLCEGVTDCKGGVGSCSAQIPAAEACDGLDNDCDGEVDEDAKDTDGDGLADCVDDDDDDDEVLDEDDNCPKTKNGDQLDTDLDGKGDVCDPDDDNDQVPDEDDCEPLDGKIYPGAKDDTCDGIDNNCNGETDEQVPNTGPGTDPCNDDDDGDGVLDEQDNCPKTENADQLDTDLDGKGNACDPDDDNDQIPDEDDCEPLDGKVYPGAKDDTCDGIDNNCNGETDEQVPNPGPGTDPCKDDDDGDGDPDTSDCAPTDAAIYHGAPEACDGIDSDCDGGLNDEGSAGCQIFYQDKDADEYGVESVSKCLCQEADKFTATVVGDCDDSKNAAHPGAAEACDGIDNDCDGEVDEPGANGCLTFVLDGDGDGWGKTGDVKCLCAALAPYSATQGGDCNDGNGAVNPDAGESCNGIDDNCNGEKDEGENKPGCNTYFADADGDTYGVVDQSKCLCNVAAPYTATKTGDCNDADGATHPNATELCDGKDNDCSGGVDEEGASGCTTWYKDADGDTYGVGNDKKCLCGKQGTYSTSTAGDCHDGDATVHPGAQEICNGKDDNCVGGTDEEGAQNCQVYYTDNDNDGWGVSPSKCLCGKSGAFKTLTPGDCYDGNGNAHPGQTGWFTTHRGDGSYDYDCNNTQETKWNEVGVCSSLLCINGGKAGWFSGGQVAACGSTVAWATSCYTSWPWECNGGCCANTEQRTQQCR